MKIKTAPILFLIALVATSSSAATMGSIYVGPTASGEAVRILSKGYVLQPLSNACPDCLGIIVGPSDLSNSSIINRLQAAYEAGQAIGLTNATAGSIRRLHDLLGHDGSMEPAPSGSLLNLSAFRKAFRTDGGLHSSLHFFSPRIIFPMAGQLTPNDRKQLRRVHDKRLRRKVRKKLIALRERQQQQRNQVSDTNELRALNRIFPATPELPEPPLPGDNGGQNFLNLGAHSYEFTNGTGDSAGDYVQITNTVWGARSFTNSSDFYYVREETDYTVAPEFNGGLIWWNNDASSSIGATATLLGPSPDSTTQTVTYTSGVSKSIGTSIGFNEAQGLNASVSETTTISHQKTYQVQPIVIHNESLFSGAAPSWVFNINDLPTVEDSLPLHQEWIWQVPFSSYQGNPGSEVGMTSIASLTAKYHDNLPGPKNYNQIATQITPVVPWPFGRTFSLQPPVVTGVSPSCVNSGDQFTIQGTGFYPALVQSIEIGGTPVSPESIDTVSDTEIKVTAPDTFLCHSPGCPVAVVTTQGTSNTNFNIVISDFCF